jgi:SAM-dependent methyltransferase
MGKHLAKTAFIILQHKFNNMLEPQFLAVFLNNSPLCAETISQDSCMPSFRLQQSTWGGMKHLNGNSNLEAKCCICNNEDHETSFRKLKGGWELVQCGSCGLVYLKNPPADEIDFMEAAHSKLDSASGENEDDLEYWSVPTLFDKHRVVFDGFFKQRLKAICRYLPEGKPQSMLDIGCGYGFFMNYCKALGIRSRGFDVSSQAVTWATERLGLNAATADVNLLSPDETFAAVVMCDVLEHLPDPGGALRRISGWGTDSAVFYIQVPNILGWKYPSNAGFHAPYHLWQFSAHTLRVFIEKNGFKVIGWHFGVMGAIGAYERDQADALHRTAWTIASKLRFGNRMAAIAQKAL